MNDGEARDVRIVDYHQQGMPPSAQASSATCLHAIAGKMSVWPKSAPLNSSGSPVTFASA
jgi:hypothetical protein